MTSALIIGKFMPPTLGHQLLIDFARCYPEITELHVIVCTQPGEPIDGHDRFTALAEHYDNCPITFVYHLNKTMPQLPEDAPDFWEQWVQVLRRWEGCDYLFAGEAYGAELAEHLGMTFIPFTREINKVRGTVVRFDPVYSWNQIIPEMRQKMVKTVTILGAESTGKTSIAQLLQTPYTEVTPEYARGYLDIKGADLTIEKIYQIADGQYAMDTAVKMTARTPFIIRDTDLITTYGWMKFFYPTMINDKTFMNKFCSRAEETVADLYLITRDDIPFEPDAQRYGGDKRQTDRQYWIDICKEAGCEYQLLRTAGKDAAMEVERILGEFYGSGI